MTFQNLKVEKKLEDQGGADKFKPYQSSKFDAPKTFEPTKCYQIYVLRIHTNEHRKAASILNELEIFKLL